MFTLMLIPPFKGTKKELLGALLITLSLDGIIIFSML